MTDIFKEALDDFNSEVDANGQILSGYLHSLIFGKKEVETIRKALLICSRLQQEPSDAMWLAVGGPSYDTAEKMWLGLNEQLMKECQE